MDMINLLVYFVAVAFNLKEQDNDLWSYILETTPQFYLFFGLI